MNRKRRLDTILFETPLNETPLFKKRRISYEPYEIKPQQNIFDFVRDEFKKINNKLELIQEKVQNINSRITSIESKLNRGESKKILNFIKEIEKLKIDNTPPKFQEPCPYIF